MTSQEVFITGTSRGLGEALAALHLERGDRVHGVSRGTSARLRGRAGYHHASTDLGNLSTAKEELDAFLANAPRFDLAYLNHGMLAAIKDMSDCEMDDLRRVMDVNLWANKLILDALADSRGVPARVVAMSSGAAVNGNRGWNAYAISKAALNMLIKLYAREHSESHFCALAPGLVDTAMQDVLCELPTDSRFPGVETLKAARNTTAMPDADGAARRIDELLPRLLEFESGSFVDLRNL